MSVQSVPQSRICAFTVIIASSTCRHSCALCLNTTTIQFLTVLLLVSSHEPEVLALVSRPRFKVVVLISKTTDKISVLELEASLGSKFQDQDLIRQHSTPVLTETLHLDGCKLLTDPKQQA